MGQVVQSEAGVVAAQHTCDQCGRRAGRGWAFGFKAAGARAGSGAPGQAADLTKCLRCAIRHRPMLRRSIGVALFVGTVLTLLNQGDFLFSGQWSSALYWKIPLTYCVPFLVATYGALTNGRK